VESLCVIPELDDWVVVDPEEPVVVAATEKDVPWAAPGPIAPPREQAATAPTATKTASTGILDLSICTAMQPPFERPWP
jgi:hypothetical protein